MYPAQKKTTTNRFNIPPPYAPKETKQQFINEVAAKAKKAAFLDIGNCNPSPDIFYAVLGEKMTIKNTDKKEHTIRVTERNLFTIVPGGEIVIKADFDKGSGVYDYLCDNSTSPVGMIFVAR